MDNTTKLEEAERRTSSSCSTNSSPEFQFWATRSPQPHHLLSADELFVDGVLLPLHLLNTSSHNPPPPDINPSSIPLQPDHPAPPLPPPASSSISSAPTSTLTASKRWKDTFLFKKSTPAQNHDEDKEKKAKKKTRDKKTQASASGGSSSAELNINIWPFSRSRSAGNGATRPKLFPAGSTRKVSSAPCSRSNSAGESKSRKWPSSPGRVNGGGVYLGRSSPVWQVRRGGSGAVRSSEKAAGSKKGIHIDGDGNSNTNGKSNRVEVSNLSVPKCIECRHHLSCTSDEGSTLNAGSSGTCRARNGGAEVGNSTAVGVRNAATALFNFRTLFTRKVY